MFSKFWEKLFGTDVQPLPSPSITQQLTPLDFGQPWRVKSFDFVADATKQLITVATGVITVTVVFSKDLGSVTRVLALAAWIILLVSVSLGILVLLNMSGLLAAFANIKDPETAPVELKNALQSGVNEKGNRLLSLMQLGTFVLGLGLVLAFGFSAAWGTKSADKDKPPPTVKVIYEAPEFATTVNRECDQRESQTKRRTRRKKPLAPIYFPK